MSLQFQNSFLVGLTLLIVGILSPWVRLDPPTVKDSNLAYTTDFIKKYNSTPKELKKKLGEFGFPRSLDDDDFVEWISQLEGGAMLDIVLPQTKLFAWDLLLSDTASRLKILIAGLTFCIIRGFLCVYMNNLEGSNWPETQVELDKPTLISPDLFLTLYLYVILAIFILFLFQLSNFDTFGYGQGFAPAFIDLISGAKVGWGPRVCIPVGLILIAISLRKRTRKTA